MVRINLRKAAYLQRKLSSLVKTYDEFNQPIRYIAGVDVAYRKGKAIGVAALLDYKDLNLIEYGIYITESRVPYIPTYLAFREIPPMVGAIKRLSIEPDITLVDSHGLIHPRGLGAASHLGIVLNIPTIGVAKSPLVGKPNEDGYIILNGRKVGYKVSDKLYISIGHRVSLNSAIKIVLHVLRNVVPEPTRLAHNKATEIKYSIK